MENNFDSNFMRKWIRSSGLTPIPQDIGLAIIVDEQKRRIEELKKEIEDLKSKEQDLKTQLKQITKI